MFVRQGDPGYTGCHRDVVIRGETRADMPLLGYVDAAADADLLEHGVFFATSDYTYEGEATCQHRFPIAYRQSGQQFSGPKDGYTVRVGWRPLPPGRYVVTVRQDGGTGTGVFEVLPDGTLENLPDDTVIALPPPAD